MSILVVVSWYLCGACAAARMVRRGHSAGPWCVGAALLGALVWVVALPCSRVSGSGVRWSGDVPAPPVQGRLVVGLVDGLGDVAGTSASVFRPGDHLVIVDRVGLESTSSLVDTGEREASDDRIEEARRRWPGSATARVASGPATAVVTEATGPHPPELVVSGAVTGWAWREALRRSVTLGALLHCPVLHAPASSCEPAPLSSVGGRG